MPSNESLSPSSSEATTTAKLSSSPLSPPPPSILRANSLRCTLRNRKPVAVTFTMLTRIPQRKLPISAISSIAATLSRKFSGFTPQTVSACEPYGDLYASNLDVHTFPDSDRKSLPKWDENLRFGHKFSDYMLECDWTEGKGWGRPYIRKYGDLSISPASSSLHYAVQVFEGMKAYLDPQGHTLLFRPEQNMARMNGSAKRMCLPTFDEKEVLECIKSLLRLEKRWIPDAHGFSLYIRPTVISTDRTLGVSAPKMAKLFVILSPVGPYYPKGFKPVSLLAETKYIRAFPGGTGDQKVGPNYGPTIQPQKEAMAKGYDQILWLFGASHQITEVGTMNLFMHWKRPGDGVEELITAPLDGTILPGVTRQSILDLTRHHYSDSLTVSERSYTMDDVIAALHEGRVREIFGAGTAAVISPVNKIGFEGQDYDIPVDPQNPAAGAGPLATKLFKELLDIQTGVKEHPFSVRVD